jgi:beta-phosphoglucomutase-like phosphatase (HAD superfamily)
MVCVNGNDVTLKKPSPKLFLFAAERMAIDPVLYVMIENSTNGIHAAKTVESRCIAVTNSFAAKYPVEADLI